MESGFRKAVVAGLAAFLSLSPAAPVTGQTPTRIGVLLSQDSPPYRAVARGFAAAIRESGRSVILETRVLDADGATAKRVVQKMRGDVDLVLALGSPAVRVARGTFETTPLVAGMVLKAGEATGRGMTGVYLEFPPEVEFAWLRRLLPDVSRVGVLYNAGENAATIRRARTAAETAGLRLFAREVASPSEIPSQLASLENEVTALWGLADSMVLTPETARPLLLFSLRNRIPFFGMSEAWVRAGAVYALDRDYNDIGRQCAELAARILRGESPSSIAPVPPRKVAYYVSQRAAEVLGIRVPDAMLKGAAGVFD